MRSGASLLRAVALAAACLGLVASVAMRASAEAPFPDRADVVVLGSEPEAIVAAVAAAESGASTVLVSEDPRLGGLFVLGALNVLDLRTTPAPYQQGLFERWWREVGGRGAFDPDRAERAFARLLDEAGVTVRLGVRDLRPTLAGGRVVGAAWRGGGVSAGQLIDGDADLRHAVAAGARASVGWESFGEDARMADTLVFGIDGVDWAALKEAARARGPDWAQVNDAVAWGSFGGVPAAYPPADPGMRLRGLNLGRDDEGRVWANALLVFGVDPFDPASRTEARSRAAVEAERVVAWLATRLPGFEDARLGAVAERLYLRETRHLDAACVLDAGHLLDNVTGPADVAVGGYPLDLQPLGRQQAGVVFGTPEIYGVPLCVSVPRDGPDDLWAVGRSVGYDPVAFTSARVVPLGMAVAEGVGVAAALAQERGLEPRVAVGDAELLADVRATLRSRGAYLPEPRPRPPVGPRDHPYYASFRALLARGLASGGYDNDPDLDGAMPVRALLYALANVSKRFAFEPTVAYALVGAYAGLQGTADATVAATLQRAAACRLDLPCPAEATADALADAGLWPEGVPRQGPLTRGEVYALAQRIAEGSAMAAVTAGR